MPSAPDQQNRDSGPGFLENRSPCLLVLCPSTSEPAFLCGKRAQPRPRRWPGAPRGWRAAGTQEAEAASCFLPSLPPAMNFKRGRLDPRADGAMRSA